MPASPQHRDGYSEWPHRAAVALCCATFPLIWVGGLVTTYDAGMAVPDWPTTYGYNLVLYPWQTWVLGPFDLLIEHGHRLLGASVGLLSMVFLATVLWQDRRRGMRAAAWLMFALVVAQGGLGGLRVRMDARTVALVHACLGLATFAYAAAMSVVTSRYWRDAPPVNLAVRPGGIRLFRIALLMAILVYVQVVLGALLRHVPVSATPVFFRIVVLFHVVLGLAVCGHAGMLVVCAWRSFRGTSRLAVPVGLMGLLVFLQLGLGGATWVLKYGWPSWFSGRVFAASFTIQANSLSQAMVTTLHVAVGALVLAMAVVVALRSWRFFRLDSATVIRAGMSAVITGHSAEWAA